VSATLTDPSLALDSGLRTEFPFVLPRGYVDRRGRVHREGRMRLATARDEIAPQADPRVRENPAYLTVLLLARTITGLGGVQHVDTEVVEGLFAGDLAFLQDLYRQVNARGDTRADVRCPQCQHGFTVDLAGEAVGEP
jgi:hypothetical protein